jgi:hypothetical protein
VRPRAQEPAAALTACIDHIKAGDLDALLEFVPDEGARPPAGSGLGAGPGPGVAGAVASAPPHDPSHPPPPPPPAVIDKVIEMRRCNSSGGEPTWLRFTDVLQANAGSLLYLDSFAIRHLAHGAPRALALLSAVRVSPERYLQRCAVVAAGGEEAVLSFEMMQQDCIESQ